MGCTHKLATYRLLREWNAFRPLYLIPGGDIGVWSKRKSVSCFTKAFYGSFGLLFSRIPLPLAHPPCPLRCQLCDFLPVFGPPGGYGPIAADKNSHLAAVPPYLFRCIVLEKNHAIALDLIALCRPSPTVCFWGVKGQNAHFRVLALYPPKTHRTLHRLADRQRSPTCCAPASKLSSAWNLSIPSHLSCHMNQF